jgi:hypothetical protein
MAQEKQSQTELEFEDEVTADEELSTPLTQRKIYTEQGDPEIESLYGKFKRGKLIVQPDYQRQFVWDRSKASRLMESALLDIPLPMIYLSEEKDGKENVIDGQQRLTSFFSFMDGLLPDGQAFRLTGLRVFTELNKKSFLELDEVTQDKIRYYKIRTITFKKESQADLKFEIFERLNTGSVSLNSQELRNCIFRGPYNDLLKELAADPDFRHLLSMTAPDKRMIDVELVLRFAAFHHQTYLNYRAPIKKFLNDEMDKNRELSAPKILEIRHAFKNTVSIIRSLLGTNAFKRFHRGEEKNQNGYWEPKKFNASLYDILMYSFAREDKNKVFQNLDAIREAFIVLMTSDQEFIDAIELSTSSLQAVTKRFDKWRLTLQEIIGIGKKEPRCFSLKLKNDLFLKDPTCTICNNKILAIDDSHIDHIAQYWTGGRTIPENARLTHRYCNMARARKA